MSRLIPFLLLLWPCLYETSEMSNTTAATISTTEEILTLVELYRREIARQLKDMPVSPLAKCLANINHLVIRNISIKPTRALGDYLGNGYDMLTDEAKWPIFKETYENCNTSADFRYYVPDFYRAEKIYRGNIDKSTKMYKSMKEASNSVSGGVSAGGSSQKMGGSFSASFKSAKSSMEKKEKTMIFLKASMLFYRLEGYPGAHFTDDFRERVLAVVDAMRKNLNRMSRWLVEEIYRDFGMDVIMGADLGIKLERRVFISSTITKASSEMALGLKAEVGATMGQGVKVRLNFKLEQSSSSSLTKVDREDKIKTWGGPNFDRMGSNNLKDFMALDNLAALTYTTLPIHKIMHGGALGRLGLNNDEVLALRMLFENVYDEVIERNTYRGCTDKDFHNFDFQANVDDNTCMKRRCKEEDIKFNCTVGVKKCPPAINEIKQKFEEVELRRYEKVAAKVIDTRRKLEKDYEDLKKVTLPYQLLFKKNDFEKKVQGIGKKLYSWLDEERNSCTYKNRTEKPNAAFFRNADMETYKKCVKHHNIEEVNGKYVNIDCSKIEVPADWKNRPTIGGFYQECTILETTQSHEQQLKQLGHNITSRCEGLNVINIKTQNQSCPKGSNFTGKSSVEYELVLKDQVNISTYWCGYEDKNKTASLYFAGAFEIGQQNSYIADNGCGFTGMNESRIFHDTKICIDTTEKYSKKPQDIPELRSIFTQQSSRAFCGPNESKHLITVINNDRVYACIFKKRGYFDAPPPVMVKLPFKEQQTMFEYSGESMLTISLNGVPKEMTLKSIGDQFLYVIQKEIRDANLIETTTVMVQKHEDSLLLSNNNTVLIIVGIALLIVGGAVAAFLILRSPK